MTWECGLQNVLSGVEVASAVAVHSVGDILPLPNDHNLFRRFERIQRCSGGLMSKPGTSLGVGTVFWSRLLLGSS
jgi:hypothetical protein